MADHYIKASFVIEACSEDIAFFNEIVDLDLHTLPDAGLREAFEQCSNRFKDSFPGSNEDPFESYRQLFSDPDYPIACYDVVPLEARESGKERVIVCGDQIDPETLANIMQRALPSVLPTGFVYSYGCSKLRPNEFGGGFVIVTEDEIIFRGSQDGLQLALAQQADEDARDLVLTTRHAIHGLSFWNEKSGFGRLADATIFTPAEAERAPIVIADDQPEWMTMPRRPQ